MLVSAKYQGDKVVAIHAENVSDQVRYAHDLSKDPSNGFTKDRSMRRIGSFPNLTLMEYDRLHPGWYLRASQTKDFADHQKAWREFLSSDASKPFMMVEKMKH